MPHIATRDLAVTARQLDPDEYPDEAEQLAELHALAEQIANQTVDLTPDAIGDTLAEYGGTLIPDGEFTRYAEEFADDIGAIDASAGWPLSHIDWDAAADDLKSDFTSYTYDGDTYWGRA